MDNSNSFTMAGIQTFIGIDLHKDSLTWCVRDSNGNELGVGKIATKCRDKIVEFVIF